MTPHGPPPEGRRRSRDLPVLPLRAGAPTGASTVGFYGAGIGALQGIPIGVITLGCDKNTVDSEHLLARLVSQGARISSDVGQAEVVIVNTCGFIEAAKTESIETILSACALKEEGGVRAVIAVGCLVQRYKDELVAELPEVDLFLGLTELDRLVPELRERGLLNADEIPLMERPLRILTTATPHTSFLKISEGCDHTCAFCAIPLMRGLHRSAPLHELVEEANSLGRSGVREINIVSQDTTWYGRDLRRREGPGAPLLPDLLRALLAGSDVPWFRLFYMYPSGITRELVELLAAEQRLLPYLDMPLQHGSDRMLKAMRRPERKDTIRERVRWLRDSVGDLTLRTTVIVGFPGETEADFEELLDLLEELEIERVGAFPYSVEEGTAAAELPGDVPESLKRERLGRLLDHQAAASLERNLDQVGRRQIALVDQETPDDPEYAGVARTAGQAIDVDGVTRIERYDGATALTPGSFVTVLIEEAEEHDLVGRVVSG